MDHDKMNNYNGVVRYMSKYHKNLILTGTTNIVEHHKHFNVIICKFLSLNNIVHEHNDIGHNVFINANKAQNNWKEFKQFLKTFKKNGKE